MSSVTANNEELLDVAAQWVARLRSDQVDNAQKQAFSVWLSEDTRHQAAFDEMLELWQDLEVVKPLYADTKGKAFETMPADVKPTKGWLRPLFMGPALATLMLIVGLFTVTLPATEQIYATAKGELQIIELADGSTVHLNTQSKIAVKYSENQRLLTLLRGEAFFDVAKDAQRPFVVGVGSSTFTAVGTAFNIYSSSKFAQLTVTEGVVQIADADKQVLNLVSQNQRQSLLSNGTVSAVSEIAIQADIAWLQQQLVYDGAPLSKVVADLNRYLDAEVRIADPSLAQIEVSAILSTKNPLQTLEVLEETFAIEAVTMSTDLILLKGN